MKTSKIFHAFLMLLTLSLTLELESEAAITRQTVINAWNRITSAANFTRTSAINFETKSEPNAWVMFHDENDYSVHVTSGLMSVLMTEDEIAGVLAHELGHIVLSHYNNEVLTDTVNAIMNSNSEHGDPLANAVGSIELELRESSFSREQETQADEYGSGLLVKAAYNSWGLYNAMRKIYAASGSSESNGFNSHPASQERLLHLAELARSSGVNNVKDSESEINELANILLGR